MADVDIDEPTASPAHEVERLPLCCEKGCLTTLPGREILERRQIDHKLNGREQDIVLLKHLVLRQHSPTHES